MNNNLSRLLVVDDDVDAARMLQLLLKWEGYRVEIAYDGAKAIEIAKTFRPQVILLDLTLPTVSGMDVARFLKGDAELGESVVVAVSGHQPTEESSGCFDHYLLKPVDPNVLLKLLSSVMLPTDTEPESIHATGKKAYARVDAENVLKLADQARSV